MKLLTSLFALILLAGCASTELQPDENGYTPPKLKSPLPILGASGLFGEALFEISVGEDGKVQDVRILDTTNMAFAQHAAGKLMRERYRPATQYGEPIKARLRKRIKADPH